MRTVLRFGRLAPAIALAALLGAPAAPQATASVVTLSPTDKVDRLNRQIQALEKRYGGRIEKLRDTRLDLARSIRKTRAAERDLATAKRALSSIAAARYKGGDLDPSLQMVAGADPNELLGSAALADHISEHQGARVEDVRRLVKKQEGARKEAESAVGRLEDEVDAISERKQEVKALLERYKPESPQIGAGGLTARMVKVRDEIEGKFGPFPMIGCLRPGDPMDHGAGKACDFMESTAGQMPTPERQAHGDAVADYGIQNASRLGIKYIIWRQRIYDMRSPGWESMSDRGSITANHMDHPHISVF